MLITINTNPSELRKVFDYIAATTCTYMPGLTDTQVCMVINNLPIKPEIMFNIVRNTSEQIILNIDISRDTIHHAWDAVLNGNTSVLSRTWANAAYRDIIAAAFPMEDSTEE